MPFKRPSLRDVVRVTMNRAQALVAGLRASSLSAQRVIHEFRRAGAVSPRTAQRFRALSPEEEDAFTYLISIGVIRQPKRGRYYLDEQSMLRFPHLWLWSGGV